MGIKIAGIALVVGAIVGLPASAQDLFEVDPGDESRGWYVGAAGGVNFIDQLDLVIEPTLNDLEMDDGYALSGAVGYGFESGIRLEAEVLYRNNDVDSISAGGVTNGTGDSLETLTIMGNLLFDLRNSTRFTPYIGAGLGAAWANADLRSGGATVIDEDNWGWAIQGIAGVSMMLTENVSLTVDYRFTQTFDTDISQTIGGVRSTLDENLDNHTIMAGLRYTFADPPPPPPAPAPPPEAPPIPANTTFLVFFDWDSAQLSGEANSVLDQVTVVFNANGFAQVFVEGHADRSGPANYNVGLSQRRAESVRQGLVARGIAPDEIVVRAFGETQPLVPTGDGVREPQNRRVEIILS